MSVLRSKSYKNYDRVSRYSIFPYYYNWKDDKYFYGISANLKKDIQSFVIHNVDKDDTLDTIALYYYNNPTYFWIVADFNSIQDPYEDLVVGTKLKIPTFSNIEFDV